MKKSLSLLIIGTFLFLTGCGGGSGGVSNDPNFLGSASGKLSSGTGTACANSYYTGTDASQIPAAKAAAQASAGDGNTYSSNLCATAGKNPGTCTATSTLQTQGSQTSFPVKIIANYYGASASDLQGFESSCQGTNYTWSAQ